MIQTPQQIKRQEILSVTDRILKKEKVQLAAISLIAKQDIKVNYTSTDFSLEIKDPKKTIITLNDKRGKGFVDSLFIGLHEFFSPTYHSLNNIQLCDFKVNPSLSSSRNKIGTDAQASIVLSMYVKRHGVAEFHHKSRSIINSVFITILKVFEFYINCEKSFFKIQEFIKEARTRNRGDVVNNYIYDLCKITEANTYDEKKRKRN